MDDKVDLTLNRDFRNNREINPRPRSIFKKNNEVTFNINSIQNLVSYHTTQDATSNIIIGSNVWYGGTGSTTLINGGYNYNTGNTCNCCGKDITRLPWQKDIYYSLCKKCATKLDNRSSFKKIPWK